MAYIKVSDRNLKNIKVSFLSKDINITKVVREDRVERFREDILFKYEKQNSNFAHMIKIHYED